jgi:hypothetical protein
VWARVIFWHQNNGEVTKKRRASSKWAHRVASVPKIMVVWKPSPTPQTSQALATSQGHHATTSAKQRRMPDAQNAAPPFCSPHPSSGAAHIKGARSSGDRATITPLMVVRCVFHVAARNSSATPKRCATNRLTPMRVFLVV